jgi:diguanylate cyclase (GGDEF)-like protein
VSTVAYVEHLRREAPPGRGLPGAARIYLLGTLALAATAAAAAIRSDDGLSGATLLVLMIAGATAQAFAVHSPRNQVFHTGIACTIAAALVLPPAGVVAVCLAQHLPEWVRQKYPWYIQSFNIANVTLSGIAAWAVRAALAAAGAERASTGAAATAAAMAAAAAFVLVNHALLAQMLSFARGHRLGESGLFGIESLGVDCALAAVGVTLALALIDLPAAVPVVLVPLLLIHRGLAVPRLKAQALRDHKTGLLNAAGIEEGGATELSRALRFDRPLSVLMIDVDGLREINNTFGHVTGDAALAAVGQMLCSDLRSYDLCGRFGGDEFVAILPETPLDAAVELATRIEGRLRTKTIRTPGGEPVRLPVSIGAATCESGDRKLSDLIARADVAMYEAKRSRQGDAPADIRARRGRSTS